MSDNREFKKRLLQKFNFKLLVVIFHFSLLIFNFALLSEAEAAIIGKPPTTLGLVGYWSMNEGSGSFAGDSSGKGNNGTLTNGPTWVDGKRGKALNFDGSNDQVQIGDPTNGSLDFGTGSFSYGMWLYTRTYVGTYDMQWYKGGSGALDAGYDFELGSGGWSVNISDGTVAKQNYFLSSSPSTGVWIHIFTVVDRSTNRLYVYVNGNNANSGTDITGLGSVSNSAAAVISQPSYPVNGSIDDVRVYNRALSATEVLALYKSGATKFASPSGTGLVGYWSMDEGSGSYATDFSGKNNAGVFPGGTANPTWVDGKRGKALSFDGSNDYVAITNANSTLKLTSSDGTFSAWVKPNTISGFDGIIGNNFGSGWWFILNAGKIAFWAATDAAVYDSNTVVPNGQWTHILVTYNNASKTATFYKNGVFDGSQVTANTIGNGGTTFYIGNDGRDGAGYPFDGLIDEVRIYNRALTAAEIQALYKSGAAKFAPPSNTGLVGYWSFDDGAGLSATDFSGKNNTGVFPGGTANPTWVNGKRGKALSFDGSNDYVNAGKAAGLDLTSTFTIAVWVKSSENSAAKPQGIIVRANYAGFEYGWMLDKDTANVFHFRGNGSAGTTYTRNDAGAYSDAAYTDQNWHHLTGVNTGGKNYLYVDGVLQAVSATEVIGSAGGTRPVVIGHRYSDLYTTEARTWNGLIDEVRVYNRALSASEVQALYNSR